MKYAAIAVLILLAGCVAPRAYPPAAGGSRTTTGASTITNGGTGSTNTFSRDAQECEREAAIAGVAGSKAEVFNNCMRARGHSPGR